MSLLGFFAREYRDYVYCPTGEGGGIDPTCSPTGSTGYKAAPASVADAILKDGLKVGQADIGEKGRTPSVYFTSKEEDAHKYGFFFGDPTGGGNTQYAIVEFKIPDSVFKNEVKPDEFDRQSEFQNSWRLERDIPPDWISGIKIYNMDDRGKSTLVIEKKRGKYESGRTMYAFVWVKK